MDFPSSLIAMTVEQISRMGRVGATGLVRVPDMAAAIAASPGAGQFTEAPAPPLQFQESGFVIAAYGQERVGSVFKFANTELRIQVNGVKDIITSGQAGGAFFPLLGLFGPNVNWFPLTARVEKSDIWQLTYRNFDTGAVANPVTGFAFLSDAKVAALTAQLAGR